VIDAARGRIVRRLIITNGDSAAGLLKVNKAGTAYLPWRDVLHEGPVPETGSDADLRDIRARFLAEQAAQPVADVVADLSQRDALVADAARFDEVELWFEHDLYDQLQLLQVLDALAGRHANVLLVQADDYLGAQSPQAIMAFRGFRAPVSAGQFELACAAWAALRQPAPLSWAGLLEEDLAALPFLGAAVRRMLEELPSAQNGLARSEHEFLAFASGGWDRAARCVGAFLGAQYDGDEPSFLGDWSVFHILKRFAEARQPLIEPLAGTWPGPQDAASGAFRSSAVKLTALGRAVLAGQADALDVNAIDRWWGGTHLTPETVWRWDSQAGRLVAP
jgi:hypothetical protein